VPYIRVLFSGIPAAREKSREVGQECDRQMEAALTLMSDAAHWANVCVHASIRRSSACPKNSPFVSFLHGIILAAVKVK
jgi:hypothetical protein